MTFDELLDAHAGQLYTLGRRFCGNDADAEDLVQEVFLRAWRAWDGFEGRSSVRTWLYTIAARACQRMRRRRAGQPARIASLDELLPFAEPRVADWTAADPADQQLRADARARLEAAVVELPEHFRVPLVLREIVGLTVAEVAGILGLKPETVRSRVHRGRLQLRSAVDAALPRRERPADPTPYSRQVCLDLLRAKQEALDRGAPLSEEVICERCQAVFATLDLTQALCRDLAGGRAPAELIERLRRIPAEKAHRR